MFEISECVTLARQMGKSLTGRLVAAGDLGNSPHRFVWYNVEPAAFASTVRGKRVGEAYSRGRWLFIPLEPGYLLVFGECGGRILFHEAAGDLPAKYHLSLRFDDGAALSATTQMWGAMELYRRGSELKRKYIRGMRPTPTDAEFTSGYVRRLASEAVKTGHKTVKALLTQDQLIPGLGNSLAQDIMFRAGLHPRQPLERLAAVEIGVLHREIRTVVREAIRLGGRNDEVDLHGRPGRYQRIMDSRAAGKPCPQCATRVQKMAYLGGACYFCPRCQKMREPPDTGGLDDQRTGFMLAGSPNRLAPGPRRR